MAEYCMYVSMVISMLLINFNFKLVEGQIDPEFDKYFLSYH